MTISAADVIANARSWVGVRFLHQGRSRLGADCLGYIAGMLAELGSDVFAEHLPRNYGRGPQSALEPALALITCEIPLQAACMVLIQWPLARCASHAAIYTGDSLIHCYASQGRVLEHGYREPWIKRTSSIWALPLVSHE